jgi:hypothetical protein
MAESLPVELSDDGFVILARIFGAFAQGVDGLYIDPEVILAARKDYSGPIERDKERWSTNEAGTLLLTRAMGKLAAHIAMADGKVSVQVEHYRAARRAVHPIGICFFHAKHPPVG